MDKAFRKTKPYYAYKKHTECNNWENEQQTPSQKLNKIKIRSKAFVRNCATNA